MSKIQFDIDIIRDRISKVSDKTRIYLGCDSETYKQKDGGRYVSYSTVVVIHIDGSKGCEVYGKVDRERNLDYNASKPILRLMNEVYRVTELYMQLQDVLEGKTVQIHLDINPNEGEGSNIAYNHAVGYVKGMCNIEPIVKPDAFASSKVADRWTEIR